MIQNVTITRLDWTPTSLMIHFNCLDEAGEILPGLGGYVTTDTVQRKGQWKQAADGLANHLLEIAQAWIDRFDEYESETAEIVHIEVEYYKEDGSGLHIRFRRDDDPFESSILFEHGNSGRLRHNQKRDIEDQSIIGQVDADIASIMQKAWEMTLAINQTRNIKRRGR